MKLTDLSIDELRAASIVLSLEVKHYNDQAFGLLEQYYLDRVKLLMPCINILNALIYERMTDDGI